MTGRAVTKTSEESNETSEEMIRPHVENKKYLRGDLKISTWLFSFSVIFAE